MHCHLCDTEADLVRDVQEIKLGKRKVSLEQESYRCPECGERWLTAVQLDESNREASRLIRQREGLLQAAEIRAIRTELGLSQAELEKLLGVGPKTVVRWERGSIFQNTATDTLLRSIAEVPALAEHLAARRGVELRGSRSDVRSYAAAVHVTNVWRGRIHTTVSQPVPDVSSFGRLWASGIRVGEPVIVELEQADRLLDMTHG